MHRSLDARPAATSARGSGEDGAVGSRESFEAFVAARSAALLRTAVLLTGDRHLAEDLVQTALARTWPRWSRLDTNPEAYVRRTLVNTYASWWRRRWNGETPTDALPDRAQPAGADADAAYDLRQALTGLPRRQRAVVVLRYFDDLTEAQVAAALGCSVGTVKSQTSKALAKLRVDPALASGTETSASREEDRR
jgi:RNA polymerase sigma-70 factor (sigma-E family)